MEVPSWNSWQTWLSSYEISCREEEDEEKAGGSKNPVVYVLMNYFLYFWTNIIYDVEFFN